ncbi:DUF2955 domain-containing protein [Photobacterium sp. SDRW27]|uniref:DUF2955 domain-containing protein n=1 Tax=Photobacterium obscurum TaxID=2829490 RepID=UPI002243B49E|nr:DUF2955 domain-containing protein [Photobacterium obscurum]MCW8330151.1 DUF2955 domain-containing protein [Photobacterium obscurum]
MSDSEITRGREEQAEQSIYYCRVLRYVLAVSVSCGLAFGIGWGLSFIFPVFLAKFLADYSSPSHEIYQQLIMAMVLTVLVGMALGLGAAHYPLVLLLLVALLMFWAYYLFLDPRWNFFATILMIAVMLLPYLGITNPGLILYVGLGLSVSGVLAVLAFIILHWLLPEKEQPQTTSSISSSLPTTQRIQDALLALLIAYPVIVFFYYFQINGAILTMVFIGILSLQTTGVKSIKVSLFLLLTNGVGGGFAVLIYELLVTTPYFVFFMALITLVSLVIGAKIYQQPQKAPIWAGVMSALLVVLGGTISSDSKLIEVSFYGRVIQIILASAYMIAISMLIDFYQKYRTLESSRPAIK